MAVFQVSEDLPGAQSLSEATRYLWQRSSVNHQSHVYCVRLCHPHGAAVVNNNTVTHFSSTLLTPFKDGLGRYGNATHQNK